MVGLLYYNIKCSNRWCAMCSLTRRGGAVGEDVKAEAEAWAAGRSAVVAEAVAANHILTYTVVYHMHIR